MKRISWQVLLGITLVVMSAIFYLIHYLIFRDYHHIFIYLIGDIAFVFIEVLMVTLIIHRLLNEREKKSRMEKLNMVIGAFFSEVGTELMTYLSDFDPKLDLIRKDLVPTKDWTGREFSLLRKHLADYDYKVDMEKAELEELRGFLVGKMDFLLRLLENPNLLEHESFTGLLWAVFHLAEELSHRKDIREVPESDRNHLVGDINRAYGLLVKQWLDYMEHLQAHYPYLFSLAMRTNPFDQKASPIVQ